MQLNQYISDLLYRYDCVVVPNFGAFLSHSVSAQINQEINAFYPPKKRLSFNVKLQSNDGVLANHIADVEQITYDNALAKIAKHVSDINTRLEQNKAVELGCIGVLSLIDGKLIFEPSNEINYLTESFGLAQFISPEIAREKHLKVVESLEEKAPIALSARKRKTSTVLKYAAVAVLALGLGGYLGSNAYMQQIEQQNILAQEEANVALSQKIQEATFVVSTPLPAITLEVENFVGKYHIVAGAFRIEANCDRKLRQLKRLGFNARKIGQNRYGLHQVVYDSYQNRQDAQRALFSIKRTQDPAAWLLIKTLP